MSGTGSEGSTSRRVALVTGAGQNLGRAVALQLARDGADVVVNVHTSAEQGAAVVADIQGFGGRAIAVQADVTKPDEVDAMVRTARDTFGPVTVLVAVATPKRETGAFEDLSDQAWTTAFDTIVRGTLLCTRAVLPDMRRASFGRVVFLSAAAAHSPVPGHVHIAAAKGALEAAARALAAEVSPAGITVNVVSPGPIETGRPMTRERAEVISQTLIRRSSTPEEIALTCAHLCSPFVGDLTGQVLHTCGGLYLGH